MIMLITGLAAAKRRRKPPSQASIGEQPSQRTPGPEARGAKPPQHRDATAAHDINALFDEVWSTPARMTDQEIAAKFPWSSKDTYFHFPYRRVLART